MAAADAGTSAGGAAPGHVKRAFDFSVSDFATIVTTSAYVDKSLMIRDFYNASSRILITAPPRFGKSTNLNMVKRFFEIEVDSRGNPKPVHTTNNYKLFRDYNLEICKYIGFFNEHFGKYPVVHIDFKPLARVDDSAKILDAFKIIVANSFSQHSYILQSSRREYVFSEITGFNKDDFTSYISKAIIKDVDELNLANSFKHLSTILNRVFGKKVFVLIDSYDAFFDSPLFENSTDREKMMSFVRSSIGQLLNNVDYVGRMLITGVIPIDDVGFRFYNTEFYLFLESHPFTKYYGLTSAEVDTVLSKVIECDEERHDVRSAINLYYNSYGSRNLEDSVYNVWSVLQYVCRRTVQSYWCEWRYIQKFKKCFKIVPIRQKLEELLIGNKLKLSTPIPLSITDILEVTNMISCGDEDEYGQTQRSIKIVELFLALLYHFGYLAVYNEIYRILLCVNIPSEDIKYELAKAVFDENMELYSSPHMNNILSALDAFHPDATALNKDFDKLICNMYDWYKINNFQFTHFLERLFINLATRTQFGRVMVCKLLISGPKAVLLKNTHKVAICVIVVISDCWGSAESFNHRVTDEKYEKLIFCKIGDVCGKVYIAIDSKGRIAYSYYFKTGDNVREVTTAVYPQ